MKKQERKAAKKRMSKKEKKERAVKMAKEIIEQYGDVFKKLAHE
jgi:hypothetical protein